MVYNHSFFYFSNKNFDNTKSMIKFSLKTIDLTPEIHLKQKRKKLY